MLDVLTIKLCLLSKPGTPRISRGKASWKQCKNNTFFSNIDPPAGNSVGKVQIFRKQGRNGRGHTGCSRRRAATITRRAGSSGNLTISARPSRGTRMITVRSAATGYYPIGYSRRKSPRRLPEGVRQRGTPHRQAAAGEALGNPARRSFPAGRAMLRHCFPAGELPENGGYFPAGEARNARRGYTPASNVPNTRRICSPLSGLATYSLAPAARAFCRSRS